MSRTRKNQKLQKAMCGRLIALAEKHLRTSIEDLSKELGYANSSSLRRVWKGEAFPDTERLVRLSQLETSDGATPNIHWLITGQGDPVWSPNRLNRTERKKIWTAIEQLPRSKVNALVNLLK